MTRLLFQSAVLLLASGTLVPCLAQTGTPPPVFDPPAGNYSRPITLTMTNGGVGVIYYTTDGTAPTANSAVYSTPIAINAGTTTVQAIASSDAGTSSVTTAIYIVAAPPSVTALNLSASPLVLPGALTLTAIVNPTPSSGAVPSGQISFQSNSSTVLGTAPLKMVSSTQTWTGSNLVGTPVTNPVGLVSVVLAKGAQPVLASAEPFPASQPGAVKRQAVSSTGPPSVALYKLSPGGNTLNAYTYTNIYQYGTDAIAAGYFLRPASSSVQSFLVHESGQYEVFDGSTNSVRGNLTLNEPTTSPAGCDCTPPDLESISIADFDNDGYSDVGVLIQPYAYGDSYYPGVAGVAMNYGASDPGTFHYLVTVPTPSGIAQPLVFCPVAITTGHFTTAAGAQLAVLASTPQNTCANTATGPFAIYLFAYDSTNTVLTQVGSPLALPDNNAAVLAAGDLNGDGFSDLIIGESIAGAGNPTGGILTALAVGDGTFKAVSTLSATPSAPVAFTLNDFNGDGNLDAAYSSIGGYSILLGDGAGNFTSRTDRTFNPATTNSPSGITSGDFNSDGLADLALTPGDAADTNSNVDIELNSASAQAVLTLGNQALAAGTYSLTAAYRGDNNFAASTSSPISETVSQTTPVISWTPPSSSLQYGSPLTASFLDAAANVAGTFTYTPAVGTILPAGNDTLTAAFVPADTFDYTPAMATVSIAVLVPSAVASASASATTITAGQQSTVTLTVDPYPSTLTATATLTFTPAAPITQTDPAVLFSNNDTTETVTINPSSAASSNQFQLQAGSTAGTITVTIHLTSTDGQDITPSNLQPLTINVPAAAPVISSVTLSRSGQSLQVSAIALSSTRDMTEAQFHFTPVAGKTLKTTDVTVQLTSAFQTWYGSSTSDQYGTNFTYTQPFTLDGDATDIQSVSITLVNSAGASEPATAQ